MERGRSSLASRQARKEASTARPDQRVDGILSEEDVTGSQGRLGRCRVLVTVDPTKDEKRESFPEVVCSSCVNYWRVVASPSRARNEAAVRR